MEFLPVSVIKLDGEDSCTREDVVAIEAAYKVLVNGEAAFAFTCTPAHLEEMTVGALYSRGYIQSAAEVAEITVNGGEIAVALCEGAAPATCTAENPQAALPELLAAAEKMFSDQDTLFNRTGCAHSCALFYAGKVVCAREDIGRHNALDKVIGFALREEIPLQACAVITSGRVSGDYMAKVLRGGFPLVLSRAAVTDAAIRLAKENNITLYGFARGGRANLYTD